MQKARDAMGEDGHKETGAGRAAVVEIDKHGNVQRGEAARASAAPLRPNRWGFGPGPRGLAPCSIGPPASPPSDRIGPQLKDAAVCRCPAEAD
ncbi:hypothetical protein EYF80_028477 [Liparis tanakae]|uniref:Uncharacterized protein n=1 Tax=Liparis tanakae TaxID=230148 RepID=A0A4Z2H8T3_9TELE|nr:hypothetical protein EYF80_028477 [Liparis tanakae]